MGDDWHGHRDPITKEPVGDKEEWIDWDYALIRALQTIEDFTNEHGLLVYEVDDPKERTYVDAKRKIDKFDKAREQLTSAKNYKAAPGEKFVPDIGLRPGVKEWPTLEEYIDHEIQKAKENEPALDPWKPEEKEFKQGSSK